jgi:hypothetical protein
LEGVKKNLRRTFVSRCLLLSFLLFRYVERGKRKSPEKKNRKPGRKKRKIGFSFALKFQSRRKQAAQKKMDKIK